MDVSLLLGAHSGSSSFGRTRLFPSVEDMAHGKHGVPPDHARPGMAHDDTHALAHGRLVAVDGTTGARRLLLAKRTAVEALHGIVMQFLAVGAQLALCVVLVVTVQIDHGGDGAFFAADARAVVGHRVLSSPRWLPQSCGIVQECGTSGAARQRTKVTSLAGALSRTQHAVGITVLAAIAPIRSVHILQKKD